MADVFRCAKLYAIRWHLALGRSSRPCARARAKAQAALKRSAYCTTLPPTLPWMHETTASQWESREGGGSKDENPAVTYVHKGFEKIAIICIGVDRSNKQRVLA